MKSLYSIFVVLMIAITIMWTMSNIGTEVVNNSNLDSESVTLIVSVSNELNDNFNPNSSFDAATSRLAGNGSFDDEDVFAREFLEGKSEGETQKQRIVSISKLPDLMILSLGVPEEDLNIYKVIIVLFISVILAFAAYRAIFGGGKVTDN